MKNNQKIVASLWFDGNAKEAVDFYTEVFPDGKIIETSYYPKTKEEGLADFQLNMAGKELTISFELRGDLFMAINAGPEFKFTPAVSFMISCKDQEEIDYFWEKLSANPDFEVCGWLQDKYGLSWQVAPENLSELMFNSDGSADKGAYPAMMQMKKLDIAGLEKAHQEK